MVFDASGTARTKSPSRWRDSLLFGSRYEFAAASRRRPRGNEKDCGMGSPRRLLLSLPDWVRPAFHELPRDRRMIRREMNGSRLAENKRYQYIERAAAVAVSKGERVKKRGDDRGRRRRRRKLQQGG